MHGLGSEGLRQGKRLLLRARRGREADERQGCKFF